MWAGEKYSTRFGDVEVIYKPLGMVTKIIAGQSPASSTYNSIGDGLPFFQGKADFQEMYPKVRMWCTSLKRKEAEPGDILLSVRAPVGAVNICNQNSIIGRGLSAIRPDSCLDGLFLYYFLKAHEKQIDALGTGSTFKAITQETLKKIEVPLPPLDDQKRIAHLLGKVEGLIAQRKQCLQQLDELLKSVFLEMFDDPVRNEKRWDVAGIDSVCQDIFLGLTNKVDYVESGGYPLIRSTDIRGGKLSFEKVRYISEVQHKKITKNRISKRGDILVSKSGTLGTTAIVDVDEEFTTYESIITIQVDPQKLVNHYLNALLKNGNFQIKILGGKTGGTVGHLNLLMFKEITLPVPPIGLQNQFAAIVEKVDSIKSRYQQSLADLEALYGTLSQKAFKDELDLSRVPLV